MEESSHLDGGTTESPCVPGNTTAGCSDDPVDAEGAESEHAMMYPRFEHGMVIGELSSLSLFF